MEARITKPQRPNGETTGKRFWLAFYNLLSIFLWLRVGLAAAAAAPHGDWAHMKEPLLTAQTAAVFDIIHAAARLVKSPLPTVMAQVLSRLHVVWLVFRLSTAAQRQLGLTLCCVAWTAAELIRYGFYLVDSAASLRGSAVHRVLSWLRYTAFVVLYPVGICGEVISIVAALPQFQQRRFAHYPWPMPNRLNFEVNLHALYVCILCLYVPGSVWLYTHMLARRRAKTSGKKTA